MTGAALALGDRLLGGAAGGLLLGAALGLLAAAALLAAGGLDGGRASRGVVGAGLERPRRASPRPVLDRQLGLELVGGLGHLGVVLSA